MQRTGLIVWRPRTKGIVKPRYTTKQGNRGNESFKELTRLENEWKKNNKSLFLTESKSLPKRWKSPYKYKDEVLHYY